MPVLQRYFAPRSSTQPHKGGHSPSPRSARGPRLILFGAYRRSYSRGVMRAGTLALVFAGVHADVYMQYPPGSNNRLDEGGGNRNNNNR